MMGAKHTSPNHANPPTAETPRSEPIRAAAPPTTGTVSPPPPVTNLQTPTRPAPRNFSGSHQSHDRDSREAPQERTTRARTTDTIRILLADDHHIVRQGLRSVIEMHSDLRVVGEASDGQEAIELAEHLRPDVLVTDVRMPRLNGVEVTRQVSSNLPNTRVISLSVHEDPALLQRLRQAGVAQHLSKAGPVDALCDAIRVVAAPNR